MIRQPIALYGGPDDGSEQDVKLPTPKVIVIQEKCAVYMQSSETNRKGRLVYYFSQEQSSILTHRWHDYLSRQSLQGNT